MKKIIFRTKNMKREKEIYKENIIKVKDTYENLIEFKM